MCILMSGTDLMWDTHTSPNGASQSRRKLQCRKDKPKGVLWLLQLLLSWHPTG